MNGSTIELRGEYALERSHTISLPELFWIFFKIGSVAFGGYMALIAAVERVIVGEKKLLAHQDLLDATSLASMLPGPVAVNVCAYVGHSLRGGLGAVATTVGVILPSFLLCTVLSYFYFQYGRIPSVGHLFANLLPAVMAIIVVTAWNMAKRAISRPSQMLLAGISGATLVFAGGYSTILVLLLSGIIGSFLFSGESASVETQARQPSLLGLTATGALLTFFLLSFLFPFKGLDPNGLPKIFTTFSGMSLMLFGGGYVFIPLIQSTVVEGLKWVTTREFMDAIAIGQFTPGPILISATLIGYKVASVAGAFVATLAIFFPPALLMVATRGIHESIKHSKVVIAAMKGIRPAVVGLIFAAVIIIAKSSPASWATLILFSMSLILLSRFKFSVFWLIPLSGVVGFLLNGVGL